jgi:hypothetical protein
MDPAFLSRLCCSLFPVHVDSQHRYIRSSRQGPPTGPSDFYLFMIFFLCLYCISNVYDTRVCMYALYRHAKFRKAKHFIINLVSPFLRSSKSKRCQSTRQSCCQKHQCA